ncbi:hypothetical protein [Thermoclostridium stercorarium]|uniref:hypothetical protein n=1 Tax=Thermoclostridium stercorarium TaxID=1510 RepID=UPI0034E3F10C
MDCTLQGIGERAGNCDFHKFVGVAERSFDLGIDRKPLYEKLGFVYRQSKNPELNLL